MGTNICQISVLSKQQKVPSRRCDVQSIAGGGIKEQLHLIFYSTYRIDEERDGGKSLKLEIIMSIKELCGSLNLIAEI